MENNNQNQPVQHQQSPVQYIPPAQPYYSPAPITQEPPFPTGKRELLFGVFAVLFSMMLSNFVLFGGINLGFGLAAVGCVLCSVAYLRCDCRADGYSIALLVMSGIICFGFARSDDGFVKLIMVCFVLLAVNLSLCLMTGQNLRSANGVSSLLDPFRTAVMLGVGEMYLAFRGLGKWLKEGGPAVKRGGAVLIGLAVAVPLVCILIPLLISADAAFSGLLALLPQFRLFELVMTVLIGAGLACVLYTRGTALKHKPKPATKASADRKRVSHLTVNTALGAVCLVYGVYLLSQLAYLVGGFSGILPEGFTASQYARRGFFEMAWLCAIDLATIVLAVGLVSKQEGKAPLATRLLCLFIGLVTVFLVISASAKMGMYISAYGLTRLRVLTEVIMVFLGIVTALICVWLFVPKMPYMKIILLVALSMGAITLWVDVDTVVAAYNVGAYQSGVLEKVDVYYLGTLGDGAVPYIEELTRDDDFMVSRCAQRILARRPEKVKDLRSWNYASWLAEQYTREK